MSINLALIGYGTAGKQHVEAINSTEEVNLIGVFEQDKTKRIDNYKSYSSWQDVLDDPKVDAIAFCVQPQFKTKMAIEAMKKGKSILLEKPPCLSEKELDELIEYSNIYNKVIGVMLQHRYQLPKEVFNIEWGPETIATLEVSRPREMKRYFKSWRENPNSAGGGITTHIGIHYIDIASILLGKPVSFLFEGIRNYQYGLDIRTAGIIKFSNGSVLTLAVTAEAKKRNERIIIYDRDNVFTYIKGTVYLESGINQKQIYPKKTTDDLRKLVYEDFSYSVKIGKRPEICNIENFRGTIKIIEKMNSNIRALK